MVVSGFGTKHSAFRNQICAKILTVLMYMYPKSFHREAVTMLSYALYVDGELVPPFTVLYSQRTLVYNMSMISLATRFPVYVLKDRLLDRGDQFTLHFTTKINYLDFDGGLRTQLLDVIKRKWHGKIKNFVCKINIIYSLKGSSLIAFTHYRY